MERYGLLTQTRGGRVAFSRPGIGREPFSPADQRAAIQEYLEAHSALPNRSTLDQTKIDSLCALLDAGGGKREEAVRALVILAHVGRDPALSALRRFVERASPGLELLAALALDECEVWFAEPRPPLRVVPTRPA